MHYVCRIQSVIADQICPSLLEGVTWGKDHAQSISRKCGSSQDLCRFERLPLPKEENAFVIDDRQSPVAPPALSFRFPIPALPTLRFCPFLQGLPDLSEVLSSGPAHSFPLPLDLCPHPAGLGFDVTSSSKPPRALVKSRLRVHFTGLLGDGALPVPGPGAGAQFVHG